MSGNAAPITPATPAGAGSLLGGDGVFGVLGGAWLVGEEVSGDEGCVGEGCGATLVGDVWLPCLFVVAGMGVEYVRVTEESDEEGVACIADSAEELRR